VAEIADNAGFNFCGHLTEPGNSEKIEAKNSPPNKQAIGIIYKKSVVSDTVSL